jgi:hypothetical protein
MAIDVFFPPSGRWPIVFKRVLGAPSTAQKAANIETVINAAARSILLQAVII